MNAKRETIQGIYCGIEVEILAHWNHCSLVRYQDREFVVETVDVTVMHSAGKGSLTNRSSLEPQHRLEPPVNLRSN